MLHKKQRTVFQNAKSLIHETDILVHYNPNKSLQFACDASLYGLEAILSHIIPDGTEKPVSDASRTLSNAERNYSQIKKEVFAIIYC